MNGSTLNWLGIVRPGLAQMSLGAIVILTSESGGRLTPWIIGGMAILAVGGTGQV